MEKAIHTVTKNVCVKCYLYINVRSICYLYSKCTRNQLFVH